MLTTPGVCKDLTIRVLKANTIRFSNISALTKSFASVCELYGYHLLEYVTCLRFETSSAHKKQLTELLRILRQLSQESGFICWRQGGFLFQKLQSLEVHFKVDMLAIEGQERMFCADYNTWDTALYQTLNRLATSRVQKFFITGHRDMPLTMVLEDEMTGCGTNFDKWRIRGFEEKEIENLGWIDSVSLRSDINVLPHRHRQLIQLPQGSEEWHDCQLTKGCVSQVSRMESASIYDPWLIDVKYLRQIARGPPTVPPFSIVQ